MHEDDETTEAYEDLQAEVRAETGIPVDDTAPDIDDEIEPIAPPGTIAVELGEGGPTIRILPYTDWSSRSISAVRAGDFESWAQDCLAGWDFDIWLEHRDNKGPTFADIQYAMDQWQERGGQSAGKSRRERRSLERMRRR